MIESFDENNKTKCYKKISKIYKQFIRENIKIITLNNDYLIKITHNHKLKISFGEKDIWTNDLKIGQVVYIIDNNNVISVSTIK